MSASGLAAALRRLLHAVHVVVGAPDYDRYVQHAARRHPGEAILSRAAFERAVLEGKARPGSRCC